MPWPADYQMIFAQLNRMGLSADKIAIAELIAQPGMSCDEIVVLVNQRIARVKNAMSYYGLFARIRTQRRRSRESV
jgi:hypothetical protein